MLSSFTGSEDHDGTKLKGLADPQPVTADLTGAQIDAMVRKAIELGVTPKGGLDTLIARDEWVVIKPNIVACHGLGPDDKDGGAHHRYIPGTVTDLRVVQSLIAFLAEHKCGARITIAEASGEWLPKERSKSAVDGWTTDWGGAFGGLSYRKMVDEFAKKYSGIQFDIVDLNFDGTVEMPSPANPQRSYHVPKTIQQCDRLISVCAAQDAPPDRRLAQHEELFRDRARLAVRLSEETGCTSWARWSRPWWSCSASIRRTTRLPEVVGASGATGRSIRAGSAFTTT